MAFMMFSGEVLIARALTTMLNIIMASKFLGGLTEFLFVQDQS